MQRLRLPILFHLVTGAIFSPQIVNAQNLLINPSFEAVNVCTEYYAPCAPVGWENVSPQLKMGYKYHTYKNKAGNQQISLVSGSIGNDRNYAQTRLLCPMVKGKQYKLSAIVGCTQRLQPEMDFYLSKEYVFRESAGVLTDLKPTVTFRKAQNVEELKQNYYRMETVFTAEDDYTHLLMGRMQMTPSRASGGPEFIFVDYLSLEPLEKGDLCAEAASVTDSLARRLTRHTLPGHVIRLQQNVPHYKPAPKNGCVDIEIPGPEIFSANGRARYPLSSARVDSIIQRYQPYTGVAVRITGIFFDPETGNYNKTRSATQAGAIRDVLVKDYGFNKDEIRINVEDTAVPRFDASTANGRLRNNHVAIAYCVTEISTQSITPVETVPAPLAPDTLIIPDVLFKFDRHELNPALFKSLDSLVAKIPRSDDVTLALIGHTDNAGADDYNQALSQKRAESLAEYLRNKGLGNFILTVSGEGEKRPAFPNDSPEHRRRNRRVEIIIYRQ